MQRYFIKNIQIKDNQISIIGKDVHHMKDVLRYNQGTQVTCVDELGKTYLCEIRSINKEEITLTVVQTLPTNVIPYSVTLGQALIKRERFELVLEKATELGVTSLIPTVFQRGIIKITDEKESRKIERYFTIMKEASEQSERSFIPTISPIQKLTQIDYDSFDHVLVCYERENHQSKSLKQALSEIKPDSKILILIGPEGGITDQEVAFLETKNVIMVGLGTHILRSETAAMFVLSCIRYEWEL